MRLAFAICCLALAPFVVPWFPETDVVPVDSDPPAQWQRHGDEVPIPVPAGYPRCVRFVWFKPTSDGEAVYVFDPVISQKQADWLNEGLRRDYGRVEHCNEREA